MSVAFVAASTQYLVVSNNLGIDGGAITVLLWARQNVEIASGLQIYFVQENSNTDAGYYIAYEYNAGTRRLSFNRIKENVAIQSGFYTVTLGTTNWNHLGLTYDATNIRGYVNGVSVAGTTAASGNGSAGSSIFSVGASYAGAFPCNATIGEVRVFNTALTEAQIATEMRSPQPVFTASLIGWWPMDNAVSPTTYIDLKAGVALTKTNSPAVDQPPPF